MIIKGKTAGGIAGASAAAIALAMAFIQPWEGRELRAYQDIVGVWTICDGETKGVRAGDVATPAQCDAMLAKSVRQYAAGLDACVVPQLPVKVEAALISWTYNVGVGAACGSTLVRKLNAGDLVGACDQLLRWDRAGGRQVRGLTNRRIAERKLCLEGIASP
jgi:GH24 family phage-related lysozyme (muramidase)